MKKCVVLYNPNSGHVFNKKYLKEYKDLFLKYDYNPKFIGTEYAGHAKEIVSHIKQTDLLVSMGGDGTFNEVMSGNLSRKKPLIVSHIPVGTTNDIGVMFGYGNDIKKNIEMLLTGVVRGMDICIINDRPFVYVAGFGKFLQIPYETPRKLKKKFGYLGYILYGIKDFFSPIKLYDIKYKVNGIEKTGLYSMLLVSNANRIAGINNFYKNVKLNDDEFEVLFCTFKRRIDMIRIFAKLMATDASKVSGVEFYKTNRLEIEFDKYPKKAWCVDGEKLDRAVLKYQIVNKRNVQIMLPKKNISKIFIEEK